MGFSYERSKTNQSSEHQWSSYSDLFMALSVIFLLLYVTASLRQGTSNIQQHMEYQRLQRQADDLRRQIQVYSALKEEYLEEDASQQEMEMYEQLMSRLELLQDEAKQEKEELRRQAQENEIKEMALNEYQQMVRNIINNNLLAKARIKRRDQVIDFKEGQISELEKDVRKKQETITQGEREILQIRNQLDSKVSELQRAYENQEISKRKMESSIAELRAQSEQRVKSLQSRNQEIFQELSQAQSQLSQTSTQLETAQSIISKQQQAQDALQQELQRASQQHEQQRQKLEADFAQRMDAERRQFEESLAKEKLSAAERAQREAQYAAQAREQRRAMEEQLGQIKSEMQATQERLRAAEEAAQAREKIAKEIQKSLEQAGVKAQVDGNTGDVVIDFGEHYFDTGRANLKPEMKDILRKAMPAYSSSLFEDSQLAEKITGVEIMGFASPTFRGRYVDPTSLAPEDREAVNFNLDLSYQRARSIFNYIFDTQQMNFDHQKQLLPLVRVTGRSYLAEARSGRQVSSDMSKQEFCEIHDCKQAQRVIIRFNVGE